MTKERESDEALLVRCRNGDGDAWQSLVNRYQRLIYAVPRRAGLDEHAAADVFQSVFAELIGQIGRIRQPDRLQAWLVTTARRKTLKAISSRAGVSLDDESGSSLVETLVHPDPLPDEVLLELERQQALRLAIAALDDRCRHLLEGLYCADEPATYDSLSGLLGIPVGSIGPTRARCLDKLRRLMADSR